MNGIHTSRIDRRHHRNGLPRIEDVIGSCFKRRLLKTRRPHEVKCRCIRLKHTPDHNPSLRINIDKQVAYCDVCGWGGDVFTVVQERLRCSFWEAARWLNEHRASIPPAVIAPAPIASLVAPRRTTGAETRGAAAIYDYVDADWTLQYQKLRTADKRFLYRRPLARGGWAWGLGDVRPILYRLPELSDCSDILVVEGEKDADAARDHELTATTNPEGAGNGKWKARYTRQLARAGVRRVYVIPDNDDVGRLHAEQIVAACVNAGLRAWLVPLPGMPLNGDLSDYFAKGHTRRDVLLLIKEARRRAT